MKNAELWKPSKYIFSKGRFIASRNPEEVAISSRLFADMIAFAYDRHLKNYCQGKLLDLGCGKVPFYGLYKNFVSENICIDWPGSFHDNSHIDFESDITGELPFEDDIFNTIILSDVLEHIPNPEFLWAEMSRVLLPGGVILMNTPFLYWIHEQPYDYYRYTEYGLRRFAHNHGFDILHLETCGGYIATIADMIAKRVITTRLLGKFLAHLVQSLASHLAKSRLKKKCSIACHKKTTQNTQNISNVCQNESEVSMVTDHVGTRSSGEKFPLGYFMVCRKKIINSKNDF